MIGFRRTDTSTLGGVLQSVHCRTALAAVALTGLTVVVAGLVVMRSYAVHNIQLIAQSASYTVEAAVVFDDRPAIDEGLALILAAPNLAEISVFARDGTLLAHRSKPASGWVAPFQERLAFHLLGAPVAEPILHQGTPVGYVELRGNAAGLVQFLLLSLVCAAVCMALAAMASARVAGRLQRSIVEPLHALADVAHAIRLEKRFDRRAAPASIAELNMLAEDFNALLDQLEHWHRQFERENASLSHKARHDGLTGLLNRAHFQERLDAAIRDAERRHGELCILYIDNDDFKQINDRFGHAVGDRVLQEVARRIRTQVGHEGLVARLGGDEFAVLLELSVGAPDWARVARRIEAGMAEPIAIDGRGQVVASVSLGAAHYPTDGRTAKALLDQADAAMYAAKRSRRVTREPMDGDYPADNVQSRYG